MFDPTAFENMKVVLEGALYDRDLVGEIIIKDRNDVMNLAKLSRRYEITFAKKDAANITSTLVLEAKLENLASELYPSSFKGKVGASLRVYFQFKHVNQEILHKRMEEQFVKIWGKERTIEQMISYSPMESSSIVTKTITVLFNRLILEEQMDDLLLMLNYILASIDTLEHILKVND